MKEFLCALALVLFIFPAQTGAATSYDEQLDRGIRNSEPHAYLLIREAQQDKVHARKLLKEAVRYSPDLPAAYFELSKSSFRFSPEGFFDAVDYLLEGIAAYKRNFWWSYMMGASLFVSAVLSFVVAILVIILIRLPGDMRLLSHDMKEKQSNLLVLAVLAFAVLGPLYLLGALLVLISLYQRSKPDRLLIYFYVLFLLVSPWVFHTVSVLFSAPVSGEMKAVVQVNEAKDGRYALSLLKRGDHPVERFSYALALKREGRYREAIEIYEEMIAQKPDPRVYNNLATCYVAINDLERAKDLFKKSIELTQLPSALYNLSQVYRETLEYEKGDEYFLRAQKLDNDAVSGYRAIFGRNPNRFVVDEMLPFRVLWEYGKEKTRGTATLGLSVVPAGFMPVIGLAIGVVFFMLSRRFGNRAYRCTKCGKILCSHCEQHMRWGLMCTECYQSMIKLDELDAKERITKLLAVYEHRKRRRDFLRVLAFVLPGSSQVYAGKVLYGLLFLWPFLFFLTTLVMNSLFILEMSHFSHLWFNLIALYLMGVIYFISNIITRRRLVKGWL